METYTLGIDFETSALPFIHPWQEEAFAVNLAIVDETGKSWVWWFNHDEVDDIDQQKNIREIQALIDKAYRIVGHNIKFDMNWFRKLGIDCNNCKLYCTQVAEFIITGQKIGKLLTRSRT